MRLVHCRSFTSTPRGDLRSHQTSALPRDKWGPGGAGQPVGEDTGLRGAGWFWTAGPQLPPGWAGPMPHPAWGAPGPRGSCIREGWGQQSQALARFPSGGRILQQSSNRYDASRRRQAPKGTGSRLAGWQVAGADRPLGEGGHLGGSLLKHRKAVLASWGWGANSVGPKL